MLIIETTLCVTACTSCTTDYSFHIVSTFVHNLFLYSYWVTKEHYCKIFNSLPHIIEWTCNSSSKVISLTLVQYIALTHCCLPTHTHLGTTVRLTALFLCVLVFLQVYFTEGGNVRIEKNLINCFQHTVNRKVKKE